jgi:hypothetical protein
MALSATEAAFLLAAAVSMHNLEEAILLPRFAHPAWLPIARSAFAFRVAAGLVAAIFWLLAAGLSVELPLQAILAGFAIAMMFNAVIPHLALSLMLRRYHPGTATAWLLVVPAALLALDAENVADRLAGDDFLLAALGAAIALGLSLPLFLALGRRVKRTRDNGQQRTIQ